jgi:hypothetical protein
MTRPSRSQMEGMLALRRVQYWRGDATFREVWFWWSWLESDKGRMPVWYSLAVAPFGLALGYWLGPVIF